MKQKVSRLVHSIYLKWIQQKYSSENPPKIFVWMNKNYSRVFHSFLFELYANQIIWKNAYQVFFTVFYGERTAVEFQDNQNTFYLLRNILKKKKNLIRKPFIRQFLNFHDERAIFVFNRNKFSSDDDVTSSTV